MKIEIMELLHKIYNLDDMPGKIIFDNCVWRYCSEFQDYQSERGYLFGDYMSHINETGKFLNAEVEIIEEDKPIIEKIDLFDDLQDILNSSDESIMLNAIHKCLTTQKYKLNEVIDYINRKEDRKVKNSEYHNRIYTEEELKEKIGV